jgi:putative nucleotidyltransferase with HDIG domain
VAHTAVIPQPHVVARSLTLLRLFLVASAVILLIGGIVLASALTSTLEDQTIHDARVSLVRYVDGVLRSELVRNNRIVVSRHVSAVFREELRREPDLVTVKVWRPDGVLAWTSRGAQRIGRRFPVDGELGEAVRENRASAEIGKLDSAEDAVERKVGERLLEVYAPVENAAGRRAIGAYEIYANPAETEAFVASRKRVIWLTVVAVFLALYAALALLVRGASATLRRQTRELRSRSERLLDSYRVLEQNALEAVQALNATVEAKDPYTAGHSARVQELALAIGEELGLPRERLDVLRHAALFHDIGKLAVPDTILTKPDKLTYWEWVQMRLHAAEGARIIGKFGPLRETVPIIRHSHERWDGHGYPDGLAGDDVPLEAAAVALADAWDAMTTQRPYARARSYDDALAEIRRGRGTQFAPVVVDAFLAALRNGRVEQEAAAV